MKEQFNIVIQFDKNWIVKPRYTCLLYTSDAADE